MKFYVVYQLVDGGGECGHTYFRELANAVKYKYEWECDASYSSVHLGIVEFED